VRGDLLVEHGAGFGDLGGLASVPERIRRAVGAVNGQSGHL